MIVAEGRRTAQLTLALAAAPAFLLDPGTARQIIDAQVETIVRNWRQVTEEAGMSPIEQHYFAGRQFLPAYAFDGYGPLAVLKP
jgi:serine/threonine-protein kinase HipA